MEDRSREISTMIHFSDLAISHTTAAALILLVSCAVAHIDSTRELIEQQPNNHKIAVFVHGFTGDYLETWGKFPALLQADAALKDYDYLFWGYPTKLFGRNEDIGTIGQYLKTQLDYLPGKYDHIVLIGHSMGGLVIRSYIVQALLDGKGQDLERLSLVILFGTPNDGLTKASLIPEFVHKQIADMGVASKLIVELRKYWVQRVIKADRDDKYSRRIPTLSVAGIEDTFVPKESVSSFFAKTAMTDGDHRSMVKPTDPDHLSFQIVRKELLSVTARVHKLPSLEITHSQESDSADEKVFVLAPASPDLITLTVVFLSTGEHVRVRLPRDIQAEVAARRIFEEVFLENVPEGRRRAFKHTKSSLRKGELRVSDETLRAAGINDGDEIQLEINIRLPIGTF